MKSPLQEGFSAPVLLELLVDNRPIEVAQIGPKSIRLRETPAGIEGKMGILTIRIGRTLKRREILLTRATQDDPLEIEYL
jgi:hypothetical protein